jgi:DNA-binding response OmpR family regulator
MGSAYPLTGRSILVVEDEPLIALEMTAVFEAAGAKVFPARTLTEAVGLIGQAGVSAAVLDHGLGNDNVSTLCGYLRDKSIPFMFYTGHVHVQGSYPKTVVVQKPASGDALVTAIAGLVMPRTDGLADQAAA